MALTDPTNTLAWYKSRVLCRQRDMRGASCAAVAKAINAFAAVHTANEPAASPEGNALWFYGMNHYVALIGAARDPLEPLERARGLGDATSTTRSWRPGRCGRSTTCS